MGVFFLNTVYMLEHCRNVDYKVYSTDLCLSGLGAFKFDYIIKWPVVVVVLVVVVLLLLLLLLLL